MTLLLACATRTELRAVLPAGISIPDQAQAAHEVFPHAPLTIHGRPFLAVCTGVGPVAAAAVLGRALARRPEVSGVLQLGVAGSFALDPAPMGGAFCVPRETWPEYGLAGPDGVAPPGLGLPSAAPPARTPPKRSPRATPGNRETTVGMGATMRAARLAGTVLRPAKKKAL